MPLFGKHKNTDSTRHGRHGDANYDAQRDANFSTNQPMSQNYGATNQGMHPNEGYNTTSGPTTHTAEPYTHPTQAGGLAGPGGNPAVPPASHINPHSDAQRTGSTGGRFAGKAERAVGTMVGSQALKEKGFQKEQEAGAFKMQSAEIAEAERLEKEALMRRERAVAHGAHPDNRHLGGLQAANTLEDLSRSGNSGTTGQHGSGGY